MSLVGGRLVVRNLYLTWNHPKTRVRCLELPQLNHRQKPKWGCLCQRDWPLILLWTEVQGLSTAEAAGQRSKTQRMSVTNQPEESHEQTTQKHGTINSTPFLVSTKKKSPEMVIWQTAGSLVWICSGFPEVVSRFSVIHGNSVQISRLDLVCSSRRFLFFHSEWTGRLLHGFGRRRPQVWGTSQISFKPTEAANGLPCFIVQFSFNNGLYHHIIIGKQVFSCDTIVDVFIMRKRAKKKVIIVSMGKGRWTAKVGCSRLL